MKAARITKTKEPVQVEELDHPVPENEEVLVRVESCGIINIVVDDLSRLFCCNIKLRVVTRSMSNAGAID